MFDDATQMTTFWTVTFFGLFFLVVVGLALMTFFAKEKKIKKDMAKPSVNEPSGQELASRRPHSA